MSFSAEKALKKRVIMLSGDEEQLRRRAIDSVLTTLGVQRDDFDLEFTSGDATSPVDWVASAGTAPFMAERRVVIVRSVLRRDIEDLKGTNLATLPESSLLLLVADEESGGEDKMRRIGTLRGKWEKAVRDAGGHVEDFKIEARAAKESLKAELVKSGKKMSDKALDTLLEMTGGSLSRALDELEKLIVFSGEHEQIRDDYVREVVVPSREWNVFKMIDAIVAGAAPEALRQLRILIGSQGKAEDAAIGRVMPMISRTMRLLWQARLCIDAGCSVSDPPASIRDQFPEKPNIVSEQPYRQSSLTASARKVSLPHLAKCLQILADTDARLKGSLPSFSTMDTLERMVLEMCGILAPAR
ncbi:MAG TPA: DNA polymerase III subunit delta [Fimbriimonas sp.]|nr:DNA polymerase III subunit delta [Fimbriimonas sp.]